MKTRLFLDIDYDPDFTDPEGLANAISPFLTSLANIIATADPQSNENRNPKIGKFWIASGVLASERAKQVIRDLLDCPDLNLDELDEISGQAIMHARAFLANDTHAQADLEAMCYKVAESAANWAGCSDMKESMAVFRKLGDECRKLLERRLGEQAASRYILYDFDTGDLATTTVYTDYGEAAEDADQLANVLVVPLRIRATPADSLQ